MNLSASTIIFLDNSVQNIFKTIDLLKQNYKNLQVFQHESELFEFLQNKTADVVFMNLDLQPNDGIAVMRELMSHSGKTKPYVVIYSSKQDDFLQELAYNSGADAFIAFQSKPLTMLLYVNNLLRRHSMQFPAELPRDLYIDTERYLVYQNSKAIQLPRREFQLLELLYTHPGKFFSKPEIAELIWNDNSVANKRIIDVHIYNLRQQFGKHLILSQKGKGYRLNRKA
ncbi:MAG TPA: response regulator transcription factor [Bacteroidia bacterium]|nr:response regulator transcription factor [Bacteroidia bacterium]